MRIFIVLAEVSVGKKQLFCFFLALAEVLAKKTNVLFERWRF